MGEFGAVRSPYNQDSPIRNRRTRPGWRAGVKFPRRDSAGVIEVFGLLDAAFRRRLGEIKEGLARQFRHTGVGMAEQCEQHSDPAHFTGLDADDGHGFRHIHQPFLLLFDRTFRFLSLRPRVHDSRSGSDKDFVSSFLQHATEIFATAREAAGEDGDLAILIGPEGGIQMLSDEGWDLEALRIHRGARAAYRVVRSAGRVRLEARSAGESCRMETERPSPGSLCGGVLDFPVAAVRRPPRFLQNVNESSHGSYDRWGVVRR